MLLSHTSLSLSLCLSLSLSLTSLCQIGSSNSACSEAYRGESAASEPETQATMQYFKYEIFQVCNISSSAIIHKATIHNNIIITPQGAEHCHWSH